MFIKNRPPVPHGARIRRKGERGGALVELALTMPMMLVMVTGIYSFGVYLRQSLQLTDAVSIGGQYLSIRLGNTLDPCADVYTAVTNAAAGLNPALMTFTITLNTTSYPFTQGATVSCSSPSSNSAGYSTGNLILGDPVKVNVTYPCSLAIYGKNLVPGCTITAQITEIEQ